jgi:hypothetical protein
MIYVSSPSKSNRVQRLVDPTHLNMYSPSGLYELLRSVGFEQILPMNSARNIFGSSRIGRLAAGGLFRLLKWDMLSASADCVAYKHASSRVCNELSHEQA